MKCWLYLITFCALFSTNACFAFNLSTPTFKDPKQYLQLAKQFELSDLKQSEQVLQKARKLTQGKGNSQIEAEVLLAQSLIAVQLKDNIKSQSLLVEAEKLIKRSPSTELEIYLLLAKARLKAALKDHEQALSLTDKAISRSESSAELGLLQRSYHMQGDIYRITKQYDKAITNYLISQHYLAGQVPEIKVQLWNELAFVYTRINEFPSAIMYFNKAYHLLRKAGITFPQSKALLNISRSYKKMSMYQQALESGLTALTLARTTNDEEFVLKSLVHLSIIYRRLSSFDNALEYGVEALSIYQKNNNLNGIASSSNALGLIYKHLGQTTKAKNYFEKTVQMKGQKFKKKYFAAALRELALFELKDRNFTRALSLSEQAFNIYQELKDSKGSATVKKNLGLIYQEIGDVNKAFRSFEYAINASNKSGDLWNQAINLSYIANLYAVHKPEKAHQWAEQSIELADQIGAKSILEQTYAALVIAEENMKNYQQALFYSKLRFEIIDEIKTDAVNKRAAEMYILQDVVNKTYELESTKLQVQDLEVKLAAQQLQIQNEQLARHDIEQANYYLELMIFIATGLLVLIVVYIRIKTIRGKANAQ